MTSRQRMLTALNRQVPDHLPATTHHVMQYFLDHYMHGIQYPEFFEVMGLDAWLWATPTRPSSDGERWLDERGNTVTANWQFRYEDVAGLEYPTLRTTIITPDGELTMLVQSSETTSWLIERPIKEKRDIDLLGKYMPAPICDIRSVAAAHEHIGEHGLVRGHIQTAPIYGQPGTWQDAACYVGIERLIFESFDDPAWVHELLGILNRMKLAYIETLAGAPFDLLELGGGDASSTVISPKLFRQFVAPYDSQLIAAAHAAGQKIVYHTCGGMMPILEDIADMGPDAMETFTPAAMGADVNLAEAKRRIGHRVCMIGGWDQFHYFTGCTEEETRAAVRRAFAEAGSGGGFILSPSDHFFDADPALVAAFADEARRCVY